MLKPTGLFPKFEVRFMEGVGHFVHLEDPSTFDQILRTLLKEVISDPFCLAVSTLQIRS